MLVDDKVLSRFFDVTRDVTPVLEDFFAQLDRLTPERQLQICESMIELGRGLKWAGHSAFRRVLRVAARAALRLQASSSASVAANLCADALIIDSRGIFTWAGVTDDERVELLELVEKLPTTSDRAAMLLANHGAELPFSDQPDRPMELSSQGVEIARALGGSEENRVVLARVLNLHINCLWRPDMLDERLRVAEELLALCRKLNRPSLTLQSATSYLQAALESGEFGLVSDLLSLIEGTARELRQPLTVGYAKLRLANWAATQGQLEESSRLATEAADLAAEAGQPDAGAFLAGQQFVIFLHRGELADIAPVMERMAGQFESIAPFRSGLAAAFAYAGDEERTRQALDHVMAKIDSVTFDFNWLLAVALASYPTWFLGDTEAAQRLLTKLEPYQYQYIDIASGFYGSVNHYRALLLDCLGDHEAADRNYDWVSRAHASVPSPPWMARTHLEWGLVLQRRGAIDRAAVQFGKAADVADEAGLAALAVGIDRARRPVVSALAEASSGIEGDRV